MRRFFTLSYTLLFLFFCLIFPALFLCCFALLTSAITLTAEIVIAFIIEKRLTASLSVFFEY